MTNHIKLLPLPEGYDKLLPLPEGYDKHSPPRLYDGQMFHEGQMRAYARANSARAIALLQAEIEALRAERDALRKAIDRAWNDGFDFAVKAPASSSPMVRPQPPLFTKTSLI